MKDSSANKDKKKFIRSILQFIVLSLLLGILLNATFNFSEYQHYGTIPTVDNTKDKGFIALSYFAVDREGTNTMISTERLEEHFEALKKNGYTTLTQKDIENYYNNGESIPERSMFLMFEDGRKDTAIFASSLLEKFNFIGTILSYGNKFEERDPKFLSARDLRRLKDSTFWEMGTNGYRLSYINVFDRYDNYLGELHPEEYATLNKYIGRNYNHYLMDFIRDENKIPKENDTQMEKRIKHDYEQMEKIYTEELGALPKVYALMHSNTGQFGTHKNVSAINQECMDQYFIMNFNREGYGINNKESNIYDLTRMQPQPYWYPNHVLMRIQDDTDEEMVFMEGEQNIKKDWDDLMGATEFRKSSIIITSEPRDRGLIRLKNRKYQDYALHTTLTGNVLGSQKIYLRADEELSSYISIAIENNNLIIGESGEAIWTLDLDKHDQISFQSIEEHHLEALNEEHHIYSKNIKKHDKPTKMHPQQEVENQDVKSIEDGGQAYIPEIQINELGNRKLDLYLEGDKLTVAIDDKIAVEDLPITIEHKGYIYLESAWGEYGYSQRNIVDDVYDGVFEDLVIRDIDDTDAVLYINKLQGKEWIKDRIINRGNKIINWFIRNL